jgi:AGCS family alanine or glycine:cation symporter
MNKRMETRSLVGAAAATLLAGAAQAQTMDETINAAFASATGWFVNFIFSPFPGTSFPWIVAWLVVAASVFTLYFGFIQFRVIKHSIALVKGD